MVTAGRTITQRVSIAAAVAKTTVSLRQRLRCLLCRMYSRSFLFSSCGFMKALLPIHVSHSMGPISSKGHRRNSSLPTICSSETQPTWLLRESLETLRWSPITKYRPSGT